MSVDDYDIKVKIVIIGDSGVGKTCILCKYIDNSFTLSHLNTIGIDLIVKNLIHDNKKIKVQLWDTAGQECYRSLTNIYCKGSDGIIFAYDITSNKSFIQTDKWINALNAENDDSMVKVIIGNKKDLEEKREVSAEEGRKLADQYKMDFFETSAKDGSNINEMIDNMLNKIYDNEKRNAQKSNQKLSNGKSTSSKMCC